jgi:uncharacterized protein
MTRSPAARLWFGMTTHTRHEPFKRTFRHRIALLEVDIDRLEEAKKLSALFSVNRGGPIAFREKDHGARSAAVPLRLWAEARYAEAGIRLDGGAIRLITFPRVLGVGFAPISLWFGHGPEGDLRGIIYEVHNTFGETHSYVGAFLPDGRSAVAEKEFHVSPFQKVDGQYRFSLRPPGKYQPGGLESKGRDIGRSLALIIENIRANGRFHVASLNADPAALTTPAILRMLFGMPMSGLGVLIAINWQALWIWMNGARYYDKPLQRARRTTLARAEASLPGTLLSVTLERGTQEEDLRKRA